MLIFSAQSLGYIAVPKTGTSAVRTVLFPKADIVFSRRFKHMTARRFHIKVAPFLRDSFDLRPDLVAVMREPEEQIRSWYRYRNRRWARGSDISAEGMGFDDFVLASISNDPPPCAKIGSQLSMLVSRKGKLLVHHLFSYECPDLFMGFLSDRFEQEIVLEKINVSPPVPAPLDPAVRAQLRAARAAEFELYERLTKAGGYLQTQVD